MILPRLLDGATGGVRLEAGPRDLLSHSIDLALYLNGPITEVNAMTHTFAPGRDVDDAALLFARFANGSIGSFEVSRYGVGCQNRNTFEINGSKGMLSFSLDDMNRLDFFDAQEAANLQGARSIDVTGPNHPYWAEPLEARPRRRLRTSLYCHPHRFCPGSSAGRTVSRQFRGCRCGARSAGCGRKVGHFS